MISATTIDDPLPVRAQCDQASHRGGSPMRKLDIKRRSRRVRVGLNEVLTRCVSRTGAPPAQKIQDAKEPFSTGPNGAKRPWLAPSSIVFMSCRRPAITPCPADAPSSRGAVQRAGNPLQGRERTWSGWRSPGRPTPRPACIRGTKVRVGTIFDQGNAVTVTEIPSLGERARNPEVMHGQHCLDTLEVHRSSSATSGKPCASMG